MKQLLNLVGDAAVERSTREVKMSVERGVSTVIWRSVLHWRRALVSLAPPKQLTFWYIAVICLGKCGMLKF